jgi:hypothetical protein
MDAETGSKSLLLKTILDELTRAPQQDQPKPKSAEKPRDPRVEKVVQLLIPELEPYFSRTDQPPYSVLLAVGEALARIKFGEPKSEEVAQAIQQLIENHLKPSNPPAV